MAPVPEVASASNLNESTKQQDENTAADSLQLWIKDDPATITRKSASPSTLVEQGVDVTMFKSKLLLLMAALPGLFAIGCVHDQHCDLHYPRWYDPHDLKLYYQDPSLIRDPVFYGHRPTRWRSWEADLESWRATAWGCECPVEVHEAAPVIDRDYAPVIQGHQVRMGDPEFETVPEGAVEVETADEVETSDEVEPATATEDVENKVIPLPLPEYPDEEDSSPPKPPKST